jgi:biotin carboxylase
MNLLITNAQDIQAYVIARCLRAHFPRIVITFGGNSVGSDGFPGVVALSRHIDAKHKVPRFSDDWLAGRLAPDNTPEEEHYVRVIEDICVREQISVIFPSLDPEMYLFAKNKERFANQGILCVVAEPDVLAVLTDKAKTILAAQAVGFPTPKTFFPENVDDLDEVIGNSSPPWVIKARHGAHRSSLYFAAAASELKALFSKADSIQPRPLVQEHIPGSNPRNYYVLVSRQHEILSVLSPECVRTYREDGFHHALKTARSKSTGPSMDQLSALIRSLKIYGSYTIQAKVDPRDGLPKLMEINPRLGHHLWYRTALGVNEPLRVLQIARGECVPPLSYPEDVLMLDPMHDSMYLLESMGCSIARRLGRNRSNSDVRLSITLSELRAEYFSSAEKVYGPHVQYFWSDPYPMIRLLLHKLGRKCLRLVPDSLFNIARRAKRSYMNATGAT